MPEFPIRRFPRTPPDREILGGLDLPTSKADRLLVALEAFLKDKDFRPRNYTPTGANALPENCLPISQLLGPEMGNASRNSPLAQAFFKGEIPPSPRTEPLLIDDGAYIVYGKTDEQAHPVLRIVIRDADSQNPDLKQAVEKLLEEHGIDPSKASRPSRRSPERGTVVYTLRRQGE